MKSVQNKMPAFLAMILVMAVFLSACGTGGLGTGSTNPGTGGTGEAAGGKDKPKPTLTIYGPNRVVPDDNPTKAWLEEQLGVKLKFITVSETKEYVTKLNLLIASGDIPDIVVDQSLTDRNKNIEQGLYLPIDDLLKQHGQGILKARPDQGVWDDLRWTDGKLYTVPARLATGFEMILIRKNWLDKLGLKVPETIDQFTEVLRAFKNNDLDGNGQKDTIPLGNYQGLRNVNYIFAAYGANPFHWIIKDGKVAHGAVQPQNKAAIKYLRSLYEEGLMEKEYLTIDRTKSTEKAGTEKWGAWSDQLWYTDKNYSAFHKNPQTELIAIAPPKGPNGDSGYLASGGRAGNLFTGITKTSKDPVAAMKYLDFLSNEDNLIRIRMGVKGEHYTEDNGQIKVVDKYAKDNQLLIQQGITATYAMPFLTVDPPKKLYPPHTFKDHEVKLAHNKYAAFYEGVPEILNGQIGNGWEQVRDEAINRMIMEGGNIDEQFDAMVKTLYDKYRMAEQEKLAGDYYTKMYKSKK